MKVRAPDTQRLLEGLCFLLAAWFAGCFIFIAAMTAGYPYHMQWMEGSFVDIIQRVLDGKPVYVEPSLEYVPFVYTPLYYYVCAAVAWFTGVGFLPARLVSSLAAIGCGALIYAWTRREGVPRRYGFIAAGLFFSTYWLSGAWFNIARADTLFLLFLLAGLFVFFHCRGWKWSLLAAALLTAAFFTKQIALGVVAPVIAAGVFMDFRHALRTGLMTAAMTGGGILAADWASGGWFSFYVFDILAGHHAIPHGNRLFRHEWLVVMGIPFTVSLAVVFQWLREDRRKGACYAVLLASLIGSCYVSRMHTGSFPNVLMPMHAGFALLAGLAPVFFKNGADRFSPLLYCTLLAAFMGMLIYNPARRIPGPEVAEQSRRFVERVAALEGDVFIPDVQFVQTRVGKKSFTFGMAGYDLLKSDLKRKNHIKRKVRGEWSEAMKRRRFGAVIANNRFHGWEFHMAHAKHYKKEEVMHYPEAAWKMPRSILYLPAKEKD